MGPFSPSKKRLHSDDLDESEFESDSEAGLDSDDSDFTEKKRSPKKKAPKRQKQVPKSPKVQQPRTRARITILATDAPPASDGMDDAAERLRNVDGAVLDRIKKALALAGHENTGEQEAKQAMRMASKLMSQYSVTQADILAKENDEEKLKRAGMSVVWVESLTNSSVRLETWTDQVGYAMTIFFDCQMYTETWYEDRPRVQMNFYGLAEQTVAAAYAFEMAYNSIQRWSLDNKTAKGTRGKNMYRRGVADGLRSLARKEKREEQQKAIADEKQRLKEARKAEFEENKQRIERLKGPDISSRKQEEIDHKPGASHDKRVKIEEIADEDLDLKPTLSSPNPKKEEEGPEFSFGGGSPHRGGDSDDDSDDDPGVGFQDNNDESKADFDAADDFEFDLDAAEVKVKPEPESFAKADPEVGSSWQSAGQLIAFRNDSKAIGDEFLKTMDVKLCAKRKRPGINLASREERRVYEQGKADAAKIDIRRRRIKGAEDD